MDSGNIIVSRTGTVRFGSSAIMVVDAIIGVIVANSDDIAVSQKCL
jgi:hypothetical protein